MYKKTKPSTTTLTGVTYIGETLEEKIQRIVNNGEPITDGAPLIYTERKMGVEPQYDIRADRWDYAIDAMDIVDKTHKAKREERIKTAEEKKKQKETGGAPANTNDNQ